MSYTNLGKGQSAAQVTTLINAQKGADDGDTMVHNGTVVAANVNKLLVVDTDGKAKTLGQLAKGLLIRGVVPFDIGLGETSTTTRFVVNAVDGASAANSRGSWLLTTTSAADSCLVVSTVSGSSAIFPYPKYGHPPYGIDLSKPFMVEFDIINTTIGASAEFSFRLSAQSTTVRSVTSNGTTTATCADTSGIVAGQPVTGTNCPAGAWVVSVVTNTSVTISSAATGSATQNWSFFGNTSGTIRNKGCGITIKGDATGRIETHNGTTATAGSYNATGINTTYVNTSTTSSKVHLVSDGTTFYFFVNEVLISSAALPSGITTGVSELSYFAFYQMVVKGNSTAHVINISNPRIYL